ncbi:MAG: HpcH/HpaI aldolase family protein [Propionibacteriaceae bacterium]
MINPSSPRPSRFRTALAGDTPVLGTWLKLPAVEVVELVALAGFDFVVIDLEHAPLDLETAFRLIGTALHTGLSPIVRVPNLDAGMAQRMLDAGAEGIMVPHVDTVEQAREAVHATRFPPLGNRGIGATSRAGRWGALPREEYLRFGTEEVVVVAQIESAIGVENAGAISRTEGIDALLVGAADLSLDQQCAETDPILLDLINRVIRQAEEAAVPVGNAGPATTDAVRTAVEAGFTFTLLSNDASLFGAAASAAVDAARAARA